jgi:class II aldolase/adducin N-terminal domain-containing protein
MTTTESGVRTIDGVELTPKTVGLEGPPMFATVDEERLHRKQKLAGALRIFGRVGFGEGVAGHITVRDPEFPDHFWVNPFGMSFRHVRVSDLILVNHTGEVVYGTRPVNRAAFVIHAAIHQARPDVISAAHSHSVHGKAFASLGIPLDLPDGQSGDSPEPRPVHRRRVCRRGLLLVALHTFEQTGYPLAGWFSFQPMWQEICRTDPDLFD